MSTEESMSDSCSLEWRTSHKPEVWDHSQFYPKYIRARRQSEGDRKRLVYIEDEKLQLFTSGALCSRDKAGKLRLSV